jgi:predicted  nucleic acid-binding Zn-ribbon protein
MPNKCVKCGKIHPDDSVDLIRGCDQCGGKFFFYVRSGLLEQTEEELGRLSQEEIEEIETDIREIVADKVREDDTVILDLEAIKILKPGKYAIDVTKLFTQKPLIIKLGPGKYKIDLSTLLKEKLVK